MNTQVYKSKEITQIQTSKIQNHTGTQFLLRKNTEHKKLQLCATTLYIAIILISNILDYSFFCETKLLESRFDINLIKAIGFQGLLVGHSAICLWLWVIRVIEKFRRWLHNCVQRRSMQRRCRDPLDFVISHHHSVDATLVLPICYNLLRYYTVCNIIIYIFNTPRSRFSSKSLDKMLVMH